MRLMGRVVSLLLAGAVLVAVAASPVHAVRTSYDLVPPRTCLAGDWGKSSRQWRVQLGVFHDYQNAEALEHRLAARGLGAESYIGAWLDSDLEPLVARPLAGESFFMENLPFRLRRHGFDEECGLIRIESLRTGDLISASG